MLWSSERVVLIASRQGEEYKPLGTGTVVAPGRILTAWHVVFARDGKQKPDLVLRREGSASYVAAKVRWCGSADLDVAVLEAELDGGGSSHPMALLSGRDIDPSEAWEAQGYPKVWAESPSDRMEKVGGVTRSCSKGEKVLFLDALTHPGVWGGLSGAAVVLAGKKQVVGVVRGVPHGWDGQRLSATPVAVFLEQKEFRDAIGLTPEDERLAKDLAALEGEIKKRLGAAPNLAAALTEKLSIGDPSNDLASCVAHGLIHSPGKVVATILADLDATLDKDREVLRDLLWKTLPLAIDWRDLLIRARTSLSPSTNAVELPLRTETIAEIILAGVDGRSCQFAPDGAIPQGLARIPMPAAAHAPFFDRKGDLLVQEVVMHLGQEGDPGKPHWSDLKSRFPSYPDLKIVVEKTLKRRARKDAPDRLPHYLLFIDADLNASGDKDMGALWAVARSAFEKELPSLRLVRLSGGRRELDEEFDVADPILTIRNRR